MRKKMIIVLAVIMGALITSCGTSSNQKSVSKKEVNNSSISSISDSDIKNVIDAKIKGINDDKLDEYLSVYIINSDLYNKELLNMKTYLKRYKVKSIVSDFKIINKTNDTAQVQYVMNNSKIIGPGFLDNKSLVIDTLKKVNNLWKIQDEDVIKVEYKEEAYNVIYKYIEALNKKIINEYVKTMDQTNTDNYDKMKDDALDMFDKYNLEYNLEEANIITKTNDSCKVKFVVTIVKKTESDYKNNRTTGEIQLKKVKNDWKITVVEVKNTENLN